MSRILLPTFLAASLVLVHTVEAAQPRDVGASPVQANAFQIAPAPPWVEPMIVSEDAQSVKAPMHYKFIDYQVSLQNKGRWDYTHYVSVVDQAAGLSTASQMEIVFDPSYQTLVLHKLELHRANSRISKLDRKYVRMLQRETQLEQRLYNGLITASIVLDDVRTGDQIEIEYSLKGDNPVFGGRFADMPWTASTNGPITEFRYRLLAPSQRTINYKVGAPEIKVQSKNLGGTQELVFRRRSVPQIVFEQGAGYRAILPEIIQLSEYSSWNEVARWGVQLFVETQASDEAVRREANKIMGAGGDQASRVIKALDFVQSEIRYFGNEVGTFSHRPNSPEKVIGQRYGDCKDKVFLFTAILSRLGVVAKPVLVSTLLRGQLQELLPSPLAFDHVVAQVNVGGTDYWLDGTRINQTGPLKERQIIGLGKGLLLDSTTTSLSLLPPAYDQIRLSVVDTFRVIQFTDDVQLESRITYRNGLADGIRAFIGAQGLPALEPIVANPYLRRYSKIHTAAPIVVEASSSDDAITIVQRFAIPDFWTFPEEKQLMGELGYWSLAEVLQVPNLQKRRQPYEITDPGIYKHKIVMEFPDDVFKAADTATYSNGDRHFQVKRVEQSMPRRVDLEGEVRLLSDIVTQEAWTAYAGKIVEVVREMSRSLSVSAIPVAQLDLLNASVKQAADDLNRKRVKTATRMQVSAYMSSVVLTKQIEAGRLNNKLKAQALVARGIAYDNLGQVENGRIDFEEAIRLAPDNQAAILAASTNAISRGDYAHALKIIDSLAGESENPGEAAFSRAKAHYLMGDYRAAISDLDSVLNSTDAVHPGYPAILKILSSMHASDKTGDVVGQGGAHMPEEWPRPIINWLNGNSGQGDLIRVANEGAKTKEQLCEAYYYMGEFYLAKGEINNAKSYFRKSIEQGITEYYEHSAALNRLKKLEMN